MGAGWVGSEELENKKKKHFGFKSTRRKGWQRLMIVETPTVGLLVASRRREVQQVFKTPELFEYKAGERKNRGW